MVSVLQCVLAQRTNLSCFGCSFLQDKSLCRLPCSKTETSASINGDDWQPVGRCESDTCLLPEGVCSVNNDQEYFQRAKIISSLQRFVSSCSGIFNNIYKELVLIFLCLCLQKDRCVLHCSNNIAQTLYPFHLA